MDVDRQKNDVSNSMREFVHCGLTDPVQNPHLLSWIIESFSKWDFIENLKQDKKQSNLLRSQHYFYIFKLLQ
jgi:hypothetical protein